MFSLSAYSCLPCCRARGAGHRPPRCLVDSVNAMLQGDTFPCWDIDIELEPSVFEEAAREYEARRRADGDREVKQGAEPGAQVDGTATAEFAVVRDRERHPRSAPRTATTPGSGHILCMRVICRDTEGKPGARVHVDFNDWLGTIPQKRRSLSQEIMKSSYRAMRARQVVYSRTQQTTCATRRTSTDLTFGVAQHPAARQLLQKEGVRGQSAGA